MRINIPEEFLNSKSVDNGFCFKYDGDIYSNRFDVIIKILSECKTARCIDVGAVGYIPNIKKSIEKGEWLHKIIQENSEELIGVDINKEGISYCEALGYENILYANIEKDVEEILNAFNDNPIDYIFFGEMLHEVDDPIGMLSRIHTRYKNYVKSIVITVPSIYRIQNILYALRGIDKNHTENRFWYSPYSLCKMVSMAGYSVKDIYLSGKISGRFLKYLNFIFKNNICSEHIILKADL